MVLDTYLSFLLFFFHISAKFPTGIISLQPKKLPLAVKSRAAKMKFLDFPSSEKIFIFPSLLQDIFSGFKILR